MLKSASQYSLSDIAHTLVGYKLISDAVHRNPKFDAIIDQFKSCLDSEKTKIELLETCKKFLTGFSCDGGPGPSASDSIREDWKEVLKEGGDEDLITFLQ